MTSSESISTKSAGTIEQKGAAQLLQIEDNLPEGVVLVNHHMHKKLVFF